MMRSATLSPYFSLTAFMPSVMHVPRPSIACVSVAIKSTTPSLKIPSKNPLRSSGCFLVRVRALIYTIALNRLFISFTWLIFPIAGYRSMCAIIGTNPLPATFCSAS